MKITLATNLRKMRRDRNLTQEDLANFLGISFQSVSKWERDEGYPDISMLPVIANFFGVTVDTLIGNDVITQEEKIQKYYLEYERLNVAGDMESAVVVAANAYREYPYDWRIIDIYCLSLTKGYSEYPGEKLSELRMLCRMIKEKCPDAKIRMHAIYSMLFAEDDEHVEEWFAEVPGTYDFSEGERREDRYLQRRQMDKYRKQKQENVKQLYPFLFEKLGTFDDTPQEAVEAYRKRAALQEALFDKENAIYEDFHYAFNQMHLAAALFECEEKEDGYATLEKAVDCFLKHFAIPLGEELYCGGLFDALSTTRTRKAEEILPFLNGDKQLKGFQKVAKEKRFNALLKKMV